MLRKMKLLLLATTLVTTLSQAQAEEAATAAPAAAPKYTVNYTYYHYALKGKNNANTDIYGFVDGTVDLQLLTLTYNYSSEWTFMAFLPYIKNYVKTAYYPLDSYTFATTDTTEGFMDVRLMAMSPLWITQDSMAFYDVSLSVPTGSITKKFPSNKTQNASYNMQLGSGTTDLIGGFTYIKPWLSNLTSTARAEYTFRPGKNSEGWNLGDEGKLKADVRYTVNEYFNAGVEANYKGRHAVIGRSSKYEIDNNDTYKHGDGHQYYHGYQEQWDTSLVAKATLPVYGTLKASLEGGLPFYQDQRNKDDVKFFTENWVAGSLVGSF